MLGTTFFLAIWTLAIANPLDSNLAYRSPFVDKPQVRPIVP